MKGQGFRNVNLGDLFLRISLPFSAWVSISHRLSGLVLFFGVGLCLYALGLAMESPEGFQAAKELLSQPIPMLVSLALVFLLIFHISAGVKHLLLDWHIGDNIVFARYGSMVVVLLAVIMTLGIWFILW